MVRNHEVRVHVSKEELDKIQRKAKQTNMKDSAYLRYLGLNSTVKVIIEKG